MTLHLRIFFSVLFVVEILFSSLVFSQKLTIGIRSGISLSTFHNCPLRQETFNAFTYNNYHNKHISGFYSSLYCQYPINEHIQLEFGLGYTEKGIRASKNDSVPSVNNFTKKPTTKYEQFSYQGIFNYLTMPVLVKYSIDKKGLLSIMGGGYAGFLISVNSKNFYHSQDYDQTGKEVSYGTGRWWGNMNDFHRFDAGVSGGLAIQVPLETHWSIGLDSHFNYSLLNMAKSSIKAFPYQKAKNLNLETGLRLAYSFK